MAKPIAAAPSQEFPMTLTRLILINSILTLLVVGNAEAAEIDVAVAANFTMPGKEMQRRLSRRPDEAPLSFGASGQFYGQITQGSPFEVLLSADDARPSKLVENRVVVPQSRFTCPIGNLVLWSSTQKFVNDAETFATLSIYNPAAALYGAAAEHAVKELGTCESTQPNAGFSRLSGTDAPSPSPLQGLWSDRFCTGCPLWCSRFRTPPWPSWLAVGMVTFGLAVIFAAALIEKRIARKAREDSHTRED
ncbi:molybdate ABC transporter substrate-binding protein [Bradyrhizobium archetypum]|uniref:molybdate ABC transporter substrate-binding protein n=1 Tax=Bradyrhizobium archetypum TaxID=2721160 RepID=UPI0035D81E76